MGQATFKEKHVPRGKLVRASVAGPKLGMTDQFLQRRCQADKSPIPYWYIDGNYMFDTADIDDYLSVSWVPAGGLKTV